MASIEAYETKSGRRWRVRYRKPDHSSTDKRGFRRKRDAEDWAARTLASINDGTYVDPRAGLRTVGGLAGSWLAVKRVSVKPSYYETLRLAYKAHVEPVWAERSVRSLSRGEIQEWVGGLAARRSPSVVWRAVGILKGVCEDAVKDSLILRNPCDGVSLPRKTRKKHRYLTMGQLLSVASRSGCYEPLILTLGLCGLRWGEATSLTCGDIDYGKRRISVTKTVGRVGGRLVESTPKNGRDRQVAYPMFLEPYLKRLTEGRDEGDLVFRHPVTGGYIKRGHGPTSPGSWWYSACKKAGLEPMTLHDLRHTAASLMVSAGANVKAVQRQLGHSSASMTLDVYADLFDDDLDSVVDAMDDLIVSCGQNVGGDDDGGK